MERGVTIRVLAVKVAVCLRRKYTWKIIKGE
jgi:hypothetical protein